MQLRVVFIFISLLCFSFVQTVSAQDQTPVLTGSNLCALEPANFSLGGLDPLPDTLFWSIDGVEGAMTSDLGTSIRSESVRDVAVSVRWIVEGEADTLSQTFRIEECICEVAMPNVFTPGRGGLDSTFGLGHNQHCRDTDINLDRFETSQLMIYDRWGELVYDSCEDANCRVTDRWDGMRNEQEIPSDVYIYIYRYQLRDIPGSSITHELETLTGEVILLR